MGRLEAGGKCDKMEGDLKVEKITRRGYNIVVFYVMSSTENSNSVILDERVGET